MLRSHYQIGISYYVSTHQILALTLSTSGIVILQSILNLFLLVDDVIVCCLLNNDILNN